MPKQNKIIVCVSTDDMERRAMVQRLIIKLGFALTPGDAGKIIKKSPEDFDMSSAYFVFATHCNLNSSPNITHQLYRLAIQGIAVVVGVKTLKPQHEMMCEVYYQGDV